ncbi:hypothetical protein BOVATA_010700 [Babesia ovata]|uniref:Uncharacterized protein n=1 Tax=Babesia ovata TaxID=189622 RepID=A0A2H6K9A9_9APIC|nr:uncharacterized protein BOVATA_010700 [Babesia ovata]GBE59577.1 hypothetical protein BOVATA_010700 [Babesia ovata]
MDERETEVPAEDEERGLSKCVSVGGDKDGEDDRRTDKLEQVKEWKKRWRRNWPKEAEKLVDLLEKFMSLNVYWMSHWTISGYIGPRIFMLDLKLHRQATIVTALMLIQTLKVAQTNRRSGRKS